MRSRNLIYPVVFTGILLFGCKQGDQNGTDNDTTTKGDTIVVKAKFHPERPEEITFDTTIVNGKDKYDLRIVKKTDTSYVYGPEVPGSLVPDLYMDYIYMVSIAKNKVTFYSDTITKYTPAEIDSMSQFTNEFYQRAVIYKFDLSTFADVTRNFEFVYTIGIPNTDPDYNYTDVFIVDEKGKVTIEQGAD